jgi:formylglycine-generating enzyme required for sulfatase activity
MLLSCEKDQVSWPDAEGRHSVFTKAVLEGLSGKAANADKKVTPLSLADYVRNSVKDWTFENKKNRQTPVLVTDASGEFVLADIALMTLSPSLTAARELKPGDTKIVELGGGVKLELAWCPAGSFLMGSPEGEADRNKNEMQHRVTLMKGFWLGKTEVTQRQWEAVMGSSPSNFNGADLPVETVSWDDCQVFVRKLNAKAGGGRFRLPTEAEWEYACRAGTAGPYAGILGDMGWYSENSDKTTHAAGQKRANAWGLFDMHGNVWEWCQDWYGDYPAGSVTDPAGSGSGVDRVSRGGSWGIGAGLCRSAGRNRVAPYYRFYGLGVRLARETL